MGPPSEAKRIACCSPYTAGEAAQARGFAELVLEEKRGRLGSAKEKGGVGHALPERKENGAGEKKELLS